MRLTFRPMSAEFARDIVAWRYDEPYGLYNLSAREDDADKAICNVAEPSRRYFSVTDESGQLVAFRCFGDEARVAGGDHSEEALDTGGGLRPDRTGQGLGVSVLKAGLSFGRRLYRPKAFRVTVAAFNSRALCVCKRAAFREIQRFNRPTDGREFVVLVREA